MSVGPIGPGDNNSQDFDLNLAPIIDALVVLIAFMLASAAFLSIGFLDAGISAGGAQGKSQKKPPIAITLHLKPNYQMQLKVTGKMSKNSAIRSKDGTWNYASLTPQLQSIKKRFPTVGAITLSADSAIEYVEVVKTMEELKKSMPGVLLGGF